MERLKEVTPILKGLGATAEDLYMNLQENRLMTFRNWPFPDEVSCNAENMSKAGFYFCGSKKDPDSARCYFCRKELDGWEAEDDPWEEHKSHARGNCAFINLNKKPEDITAKENMKLEQAKFKCLRSKMIEKSAEFKNKRWNNDEK